MAIKQLTVQEQRDNGALLQKKEESLRSGRYSNDPMKWPAGNRRAPRPWSICSINSIFLLNFFNFCFNFPPNFCQLFFNLFSRLCCYGANNKKNDWRKSGGMLRQKKTWFTSFSINLHQSALTSINLHQSAPVSTNQHQSASIIINQHQLESISIN